MTEANQRVSVTEAYNDSCVIQQIRGLKDSKQDKLTAGTNITISSENVISANDEAITWGIITGDIEDQTDLQEALADLTNNKQDKLTAGTNITISSENVISANDAAATWGSITGDIEDQTDLQEALADLTRECVALSSLYTVTDLFAALSDMKVGDELVGRDMYDNLTTDSYFKGVRMMLSEKNNTQLFFEGFAFLKMSSVNYTAFSIIIQTTGITVNAFSAAQISYTIASSAVLHLEKMFKIKH